ncbi:Tol-Pal system protein TolQ [Halomonadaceae bacterium LMG 33818]|uniref:MotA/TolQ/ExbB proton channel family protein n=1 Tax=Cernens ardua TaxID=3402176 RepID=UPI003EDC3FF7
MDEHNNNGASSTSQAPSTDQQQVQTQSPAHDAHTVEPASPNMMGQSLLASPAANYVVPAVLWVLVAFVIISWAMLLIKGLQFGRFQAQRKRFLKQFWASDSLLEGESSLDVNAGAVVTLARTGFDVITGRDLTQHNSALVGQVNRGERLVRSLRRQMQLQKRSLESGLAILASIGSTAPFIGLFGTVWGIMEALVHIGETGQADLGSVAGPIGHALIATGVGIAAAVPAVLIYNYFIRRLKIASGDMENFSEEFYRLSQEVGFHLDGTKAQPKQ